MLPVIAIPTTAGTGSEVTHGTVLENPERPMKAASLSVYAYPRVAIVDPELTYTMPVRITAMTGFDALTHGIEAYLNVEKCDPVRSLCARIGLTEMWIDAGIDGTMLNLLTDDVFAYMGRPVQHHRPVFTRAEIRQQFEEALIIS